MNHNLSKEFRMLRHVILISAILLVVFITTIFFLRSGRKKHNPLKLKIKKEPTFGTPLEEISPDEPVIEFASIEPASCEFMEEEVVPTNSKINPSVILIQIRANPGRPYMGYELLQTLLANNFRFGEMQLFHRYEFSEGKGQVLFSLAAATQTGAFELNNMGAFSCAGLVMFMQLEQKKKLMAAFDLMLDTSRQLIEDLGGQIYDENEQPIDANIIKQWRQKICTYEEKNLYTSDLLDNL